MKTQGSIKLQFNLSKRLSLLLNFIKVFLLLSLLLRVVFYFWQWADVSWNPFNIIRTLATGFFFDLGTCSFIVLPAIVYIFIMPNRFIGTEVDKSLIYIFFTIIVFVLMFTFLAELTFWEEF